MKNILILFYFLTAWIVHAQNIEFHNQPGWSWLFPPIPLPRNLVSIQGNILSCHELKNGDLLLHVATATKEANNIYSMSAVALDSHSGRYDFIFQGGGGSEEIFMYEYILPSSVLPLSRVRYIGLEVLTYDSLKSSVAPSAFAKLISFGIPALPYPEINKPYAFDLLTIEGKPISSASLLGKVILLDFWASWCSPCMAKMGDLKEWYRLYKQKGIEIIGINYDPTVETAKKFITRDQLSWPQVFAPADNEKRELWYLSCGVRALPRLLIIDRKGILRSDIQPNELKAALEKYISE